MSQVSIPDSKVHGPTWGPHGSCRPQMGPRLVTWTWLSGYISSHLVSDKLHFHKNVARNTITQCNQVHGMKPVCVRLNLKMRKCIHGWWWWRWYDAAAAAAADDDDDMMMMMMMVITVACIQQRKTYQNTILYIFMAWYGNINSSLTQWGRHKMVAKLGWRFQMYLLVWKQLCFDSLFTEVCSQWSYFQQVSVVSDSGLGHMMAIVSWSIYAPLGLDGCLPVLF